MAQECRKAEGRKDNVNFVLEHPSPPEEMPEVVAIWRTSAWKTLKELYHLQECEVDQGRLGKWSFETHYLGYQFEVGVSKADRSCQEEEKGRRKDERTASSRIKRASEMDTDYDELHC